MRNINKWEMEKVTLPRLAAKYMAMLMTATEQFPLPTMEVVHKPGARYGARCWNRSARKLTSHIQIQYYMTQDERTLARTVAHEVIHHIENMRYGYAANFMNHGAKFREMMQQINAVEGEGFVELKCGEDNVRGKLPRPVFVVMWQSPGKELPDVAWFARHTLRTQANLAYMVKKADHVTRIAVTDESVVTCAFPKFSTGRFGMPSGNRCDIVRALWESPKAKTITINDV